LMAQWQASSHPLPRALDPEAARREVQHAVTFNEPAFRYALNDDAMATEKLAEGIRAFAADASRLDKMIEGMK
jgi:transaldolase